MDGLVLAAGRGERLYPLTAWLPKFMVPVVDRPMVCYPLQFLKSLGCTRISLVLPLGGMAFLPHLSHFISLEGIVSTECVAAGEPVAVLVGLSKLLSDLVCIIFCDNIFDPTARVSFSLFRPPFFLIVRDIELARTGRYGIVDVSSDVPVIRRGGIGDVIQTGFFMFRRGSLVQLEHFGTLGTLACSLPGFHMEEFDSWWFDVGEFDMKHRCEERLIYARC